MTEVKAELKEFRVRLNEKEITALLEVIDLACVKFMADSEKAKQKISELIKVDVYGQSPEFKQLVSISIESKRKFHLLETIEKHFKLLQKGKTKGRRARVDFWESRYGNFHFIDQVRERIREEENQQCKTHL